MRTIVSMTLLTLAAVCGCRASGEKAENFDYASGPSRVRTISATLRMVLELEPGAPIELDGIMVADLPHAYRLQLWKLKAPVLDITRTRRGTWVLNRLSEEELGDARTLEHANFQKSIALISGGFRMAGRLHARAGLDSSCLRTRTSAGPVECCPSGESVACTLAGKRGRTLGTAVFVAFRPIGSSQWPTDVAVNIGGGNLRLIFDEVEINQPLAPSAFVPPRQARKVR